MCVCVCCSYVKECRGSMYVCVCMFASKVYFLRGMIWSVGSGRLKLWDRKNVQRGGHVGLESRWTSSSP